MRSGRREPPLRPRLPVCCAVEKRGEARVPLIARLVVLRARASARHERRYGRAQLRNMIMRPAISIRSTRGLPPRRRRAVWEEVGQLAMCLVLALGASACRSDTSGAAARSANEARAAGASTPQTRTVDAAPVGDTKARPTGTVRMQPIPTRYP